MYQKYTGVILKKHPFGEADEMLTVYTRDEGKLRAKARGTRKINSRLSGHIQSLNEVEFETATGSRKSANFLPVLISVRVVTLNNYLRENLQKFAWALVGTESLYRLTGDGDKNEDLYCRFIRYLTDIRDQGNESVTTRMFQLELLEILGFGIDFENMRLSSVQIDQLKQMMRAGKPSVLPTTIERAIEEYMESVMEREVKSSSFARETDGSRS